MATSKCPKCDGSSFEIVPAHITAGSEQFRFIQCSDCGVVISAMPAEHLASQLVKALAILEDQIKNLRRP